MKRTPKNMNAYRELMNLNDEVLEALEGLLPAVQIKDEYDVKINEGARGQYNKLVLPKQYHMKWQTASAKIHRIAVKLTVIKLEADDV